MYRRLEALETWQRPASAPPHALAAATAATVATPAATAAGAARVSRECTGAEAGGGDVFAEFLAAMCRDGAVFVWRQRLVELDFLYRLRPTFTHLHCLARTYEHVRTSEALRYVLRVVLAVGNFLNTHRRPHATHAFSIESATKLRDVKGND